MPEKAVVMDSAVKESQLPASFADARDRLQFILLQTLVTIVLCYQLLFSRESFVTSEAKEFIILGLLLFIAGVMFLPARLWESGWPIVGLVLGDTAITTVIIYLSGTAGSSLYLTYFLVMLIGAFAPSLKQMIGLSIILCATYGMLLYLDSLETGSLSEGRLLGITVLLIMAVFYGATTETVRRERQKKASLMEQINTLKRIEVAGCRRAATGWLLVRRRSRCGGEWEVLLVFVPNRSISSSLNDDGNGLDVGYRRRGKGDGPARLFGSRLARAAAGRPARPAWAGPADRTRRWPSRNLGYYYQTADNFRNESLHPTS